ncbi:MAG TPA: ectonucleotide pyrophosphatase/phosphodiesterase [Asticcacaulis sp.]|nr:ectonucleotide pyrophosphatase/phosphodiesterase [Asticcacaulis sp.]
MKPAAWLAAALLLAATPAAAEPVLMISIDGLRPADVTDAKARGLNLPVLTGLAQQGMYAAGVRNALPTVTYPNHTTLITGVWPAKHGIANNVVFDPLKKNMDGWYWYASDIKVRTLWDAVHDTHGTVASISWPVSVGASSIDYNIPEFWRAWTDEDTKLVRALSTPGLIPALENAGNLSFADALGTDIKNDDARAKFAAAIIATKHPTLFTLHLSALDHIQHEKGPGSPEAHAVLEQLDTDIGQLITAARQSEPDLVVVIVSDHGFAPLAHESNIYAAFVDAGLITLDPKTHKPTSWLAEPWGGASAAVVLANPEDAAVKAKVKALLDKLAADPQYGIDRIADATEVAQMGGTPRAAFWIDFKPGYEMGQDFQAAPVTASKSVGMHGYFPAHPEMRATFIMAGPGVPAKGSVGEIDMRDIAPTVAKALKVALPDADGKPLY